MQIIGGPVSGDPMTLLKLTSFVINTILKGQLPNSHNTIFTTESRSKLIIEIYLQIRKWAQQLILLYLEESSQESTTMEFRKAVG